MAKSMRRTLLLAKIQTVEGTDAAPTALLNAILIRNLTATPISAEYVERALIRPYMGNSGQIATTQYAQVECEVELAGSGLAGTAPAWGALLRACGFSETIVASTSVTYAPVSSAFERLSLHYYLDGLFHQIIDAVGTVTLDITSKAIPFLRFRFMGAYKPIIDQAMPSGVSYTRFVKPQAVNKANTPTWSLGGYQGCLQSASVDVANQLVWRSLISCEGAQITNRNPTGALSLELPSIAALNWPRMVLDSENVALAIQHGKTAGNIVELLTPTAQLTNPTYSEADDVAMLGLQMNLTPNAGNDEIKIVVR